MQDCVWYHNIGRCFGFIFLLSAFCCSYSLCFDLEVKLSELKPGSFHKLNGEDEGVVALLLSCPMVACLYRQIFYHSAGVGTSCTD